MSYRIHPLDALPGLHIEFADAVTGATIVEALHSLSAHIDASSPAEAGTLLWDAREVTSLVVGSEDLPAIATAIQEMTPALQSGRSAIVFRQGQFDPFLFAKLLSAKAPLPASRGRAMFTDVDEAYAWLSQGRDEAA